MINEHDMTKAMLDKMRSTNILREYVEPASPEVGEVNNEVQPTEEEAQREIIIVKNGEIQPVSTAMSTYWEGPDGEKNKFMQSVTQDVTFTSFAITPKAGADEGNVKLSGILDAYDLGFTMNKKQSLGLTITTTPENSQGGDVKLTPEFMETIKKLNGYYQNWYKDWANKLNTENFTNA